mgnify:CR=1 FL=1
MSQAHECYKKLSFQFPWDDNFSLNWSSAIHQITARVPMHVLEDRLLTAPCWDRKLENTSSDLQRWIERKLPISLLRRLKKLETMPVLNSDWSKDLLLSQKKWEIIWIFWQKPSVQSQILSFCYLMRDCYQQGQSNNGTNCPYRHCRFIQEEMIISRNNWGKSVTLC